MKYNLSEINEIIRNRRTIYPEQYSERKVLKDQLDVILNNALWAPTHGNTQPWRFQVFMSEESRKALSEISVEIYKDNTPEEEQNSKKIEKLGNRPLMTSVVVAVTLKRDEKGKISEQDEFGAIASAIQNMHLTCTAYGLGGFWATPGIIKSEKFKRFLHLEGEDKCVGLFYIGYPAIEWPKAHRKPLEYVTEWK
jgi:nitroreductase